MVRRGVDVYDILQHVRPIVLHSTRVVESRARDLGWTVGSRAVAEVLCSAGPLTVPAMASRLSLARQNVQRHVDQLVRLSHARTSPNPDHLRSVLVELTAEGREAFSRLHAAELHELSQLAPGCSTADLHVAARVLAALDDDIRRRAATPRQAP